jgi:glycosyltransferase involved in cell wall biosynthesis
MRIIVCSGYGYWGELTPNDLKSDERQIGGGETAMFSLSKELASLGHEVIAFYDMARPGRYDGVDYLPSTMYVQIVTNMEHDVLVSWDYPHAFRFNDRAKVHVLALQLNDTYVGPFDYTIDRYFHPSQWHSTRFHKLYPEMSTTKSVARITNGIDHMRYTQAVGDRVPHRVIYSSSPDRGLHHLLRIWPTVVEKVPDAELWVFYDMQKWLKIIEGTDEVGLVTVTTERAHILKEQMDNGVPRVQYPGAVGQWRLAREQLQSAVLAYPCDPVQPTEGFSMTILEGLIAGCKVITTNADALPELWASAPNVTMLPLPIDDNQWVDALVQKLTEPPIENVYINQAMSWKTIAQRWVQEFNICLSEQKAS